MARKKLEELRSQRWFGADDLRSFGHRSRMLQMGYERDDFMAKPVIGIINTWSDLNPVPHAFPAARRGHQARHLAGGRLPGRAAGDVARPRITSSRPPCSTATSSPWRSRSCCAQHPVDGAVLMGGCDKTTPGTIMGGISHEPADHLHAGRPDDARPFRRQDPRLGLRRLEILGREGSRHDHRGQQWNDMEAGIARSAGTCMTMGTASTMTSIAEALGLLAARRILDPGGRRRASAHGVGMRAAHRRNGLGGPEAVRHHRPALGRERARGPQRARGLDQRHDPSRRHGAAAAASRSQLNDFDDFAAEGAGDRQPAPLGRVADGGFLHRRRHPRRS